MTPKRPRPKTPAGPPPRLTACTYGLLGVVATADYPPGTPADPTPAQHAAAFADVLAAVCGLTDDLRDCTFFLQPARNRGAWAATEGDGWTLPQMLDRVSGRAGVRS